MIYGIDVSHWTDKLDYDKLMVNGYGTLNKVPAFNFAKATEGRYFKDNLYKYHLDNSKRVGILTGAYHYYREGQSPSLQGREFAKVYNDNGGTDLPPCIDVEVINNPSLSAKNVADCLNEIEEHTGRKCIIYTGYYVWRDKMKGASFGKDHPLWIATYAKEPMIPSPWTDWRFWQFSDSKGDENWFNGTLKELYDLCGKVLINNETPIPVETHWYDGLSDHEILMQLLEGKHSL